MSERDKESEIGTDGWGGQAGGWVGVCGGEGGCEQAWWQAQKERDSQADRQIKQTNKQSMPWKKGPWLC